MSGQATMNSALTATTDPAWCLAASGHDLVRESNLETRFAISNGFLGVRGALAINRHAQWVVPHRTYVAGLFDTPDLDGATSILIPAADWLQVGLSISDEPDARRHAPLSDYHLTLDMRRGLVLIDCRVQILQDLAITVRTLRLVSMRDRALGLQLIQFETETGIVDASLEASFGGLNLGLAAGRCEQGVGLWQAKTSGKSLAIAFASSLQIDGQEVLSTAHAPFSTTWRWKTHPGQVACFERLVAFDRSDTSDEDPRAGACERLEKARPEGWYGVLTNHVAAWAIRWDCSDVEVDSDGMEQQALRFAIYHLNSAANPHDERVSIGARALTGDDYHGHVFWDTEIYLLPFYMMTWPDAARAMLMYRFQTLGPAREKAARMGWRGALYAWESADSGAETTPVQAIGPDRKVVDILCGTQEQHISADVAYAVWHYWKATGDEGFLRDAGAEILLETGRFWASRATLESDGWHHIRGIIGPDEYHEHVHDNAFTNVMARWNIRKALDVTALLRKRWPDRWLSLSSQLGIDDAELRQWQNVADAMATGLDPTTGLFEQFEGFFALDDIDLMSYAGRSVPMDVVLGRERMATSKVVKQADVVALLALLPGEFAGETAERNFRYYESLCSHGSSLSRAMHGLVAARLGHADEALAYFDQTSAIDLGDTHVAIAGGLHIAALGGVWQIAVFGFAGLTILDDGIGLEPQLPSTWRRLGFKITWRGRHLHIRIDRTRRIVEATLDSGDPMMVSVCGTPQRLQHGLGYKVSFAGSDAHDLASHSGAAA